MPSALFLVTLLDKVSATPPFEGFSQRVFPTWKTLQMTDFSKNPSSHVRDPFTYPARDCTRPGVTARRERGGDAHSSWCAGYSRTRAAGRCPHERVINVKGTNIQEHIELAWVKGPVCKCMISVLHVEDGVTKGIGAGTDTGTGTVRTDIPHGQRELSASRHHI
jgi:hypothetical protein